MAGDMLHIHMQPAEMLPVRISLASPALQAILPRCRPQPAPVPLPDPESVGELEESRARAGQMMNDLCEAVQPMTVPVCSMRPHVCWIQGPQHRLHVHALLLCTPDF